MLQREAIQLIKDVQQESIKSKQLVESQLTLIYANNWFNIWVPKEYGGAEYSFKDGLELLKELAYYDAGLAWTVTLCSGANMFAGFIQPDKAKEVFGNPKVCFGGSGRATGKAVWDGEQYTISGMWSFATGAPHLSHFTLNAPIYDGEVPRLDEEGKVVVMSFFVPRDKVLIHYDWNTFGLECTASHSFSLENVKVDVANSFLLLPEKRHVDSALYRIPFMPFAEFTLLVNYVGMYKRFLHLIEKYFFEKSKEPFWAENYSKERFKCLDRLQQKIEADEVFISTSIDRLWNEAQVENCTFDEIYLADLSKKNKAIVADIRMQVAEIIPLLGIQAAQLDSEINIVFRNLFTATQHSLLNAR